MKSLFKPLICLAALAVTQLAPAQTAGDYRSVANGAWTDLPVWQKYDGATWNAATTVPASADGVITIATGTLVTNTATRTVDQVIVQAGATLASTANLTVANGADAADLDVSGTFIGLGGTSLTIAAGANVVVESGGVMIHNGTSSSFVTITGTLQISSGGKFQLQRAGGTIPIATWSAGSQCEIAYSTASTSKPSPQSQTFDQFIWNNPLQSGSTDLAGVLTNFNGNFLLANSGGQEVKWSGDANFGANLIISNGSLNVSGSTATRTWTLKGDLNIATNAQLNVSGGSGANYTLIINGTGTQNYTCNGTNIATKLNWTVNSGSTLNLNSDLPITTAGRTLTANGNVNLNGKTILTDLIAGTGTIRNQGSGTGKLVIGVANSTNTLDGTLALTDGTGGSLALVKGGNSGSSGLLTITAPQTFSGGLIISNGITLINNTTGSGSGSGGINVLNGTLGGTGTVTGPVNLTAGTLSPGAFGIGTFTVNGTLNLAGNTSIDVNKGTGRDQVTATTVNYGGSLTIVTNGNPFVVGDTFQIFNAGSHANNFGSIVGSPGTGMAWSFDPSYRYFVRG